MNTMKQEKVEELIDSMSNGRIFSVQFVKKDGTVRDMVCRKGVRKGVKGTGAGWGQGALKPLRTVYDMHKAAHSEPFRQTEWFVSRWRVVSTTHK